MAASPVKANGNYQIQLLPCWEPSMALLLPEEDEVYLQQAEVSAKRVAGGIWLTAELHELSVLAYVAGQAP